MSELSRRGFLRNTTLTTTALWYGSHGGRQAFAQEPILNLYLAIWPSETRLRLPWNDPFPRTLAERFCYQIWNFVHVQGGGRLATALFGSKKSIIGHTSLLAEMRDGGSVESTLFSNTSESNPGIYEDSIWFGWDGSEVRFPEEYESTWIVAAFYVDELLAGHVEDGEWETLHDYRRRVDRNKRFRVIRRSFRGSDAKRKFALLKEIKRQTRDQGNRFGAPRHFGLNTSSVRLIDNHGLGRGNSLSKYRIGGSYHEIHGGCANAVASVLRAVGLGNLVPRSAVFEMAIDLARFSNLYVPIIVGSGGFENRAAIDEDLVKALDRLPEKWGSGTTVKFVDPNYWYREIPDGQKLKDDYRSLLRSLSR